MVSGWLHAQDAAERRYDGRVAAAFAQAALRRQLDVAKDRIKLPELSTGDVVNLQKQILDLQEQLHELSQPSPARPTISCRSRAARKIERLSQILNRIILARHSKRRGGSRQSSAQRLNRSNRRQRRIKKTFRSASESEETATNRCAQNQAHHACAERDLAMDCCLEAAQRIAPASVLYSAIEVQNRIRELIKLAKEQGYLTFDDLNEALPEGVTDADELDLILTRLRRMEIDIIEASEVDRYKDGKKDADEEEEEEEKTGSQASIFSTIRCGCISSRWARFRC